MGFSELESDIYSQGTGLRDKLLLKPIKNVVNTLKICNSFKISKDQKIGRQNSLHKNLVLSPKSKNPLNMLFTPVQRLFEKEHRLIYENIEDNKERQFLISKSGEVKSKDKQGNLKIARDSRRKSESGMIKRQVTLKNRMASLQKIASGSVKIESESSSESENENEEELGEVKFVFNDKEEITLTSDTDVLPKRRKLILNMEPQDYRPQPYKIKLIFVPSELPDENDDDAICKRKIQKHHNHYKNALNTNDSHIHNASNMKDYDSYSEIDSDKESKKEEKLASSQLKTRIKRQFIVSRPSSFQSTPKIVLKENVESATDEKEIPLTSDRSERKALRATSIFSELHTLRHKNDSDESSIQEPPKRKLQQEKNKKGELLKVPIIESFSKIKKNSEAAKPDPIPWSGQDALYNSSPYAAVWATENQSEIRLWKKGAMGYIKWFRHILKIIVNHDITSIILNLRGITATVILAMYRYGQPPEEAAILKIISTVFTYTFMVEMALKIAAQGIVAYVTYPLNYIDAGIVILSLVEMIFMSSESPVIRAFQAFSVLRILRLVRMVRLLKILGPMRLLIQVISNTITSFAYIGILIFVFLYIYALLGMQLFGGKFDFPEGKPRQNFDSFHNAFLSVYQVLTIENWHILQYFSMRAQIPVFVALFYVSWIFIGNYVLLNLFLVLVLDAFSGSEDDSNKEDEEQVFFLRFTI